ncbi:jg7424, partial [Pararge aegeria aegeria]
EKFKKEFKQRFTFRQKRNRFSNDSYEDGQSYRTRVVSIRSTNERSVYSTRKSINITPVDSLKVSRSSCHCARNQNRDLDRENLYRSRKSDEFGSFRNGTNQQEMSGRKPMSNRFGENDLPIGDERVSELYIFPNSSIVEFTDVICDNKV